MKYIRTILALLLTIFCGAGGGIFLTFTDQSLIGTLLYMAFPFAVAVLFMAIGWDLLSERRVAEQPETKAVKGAETPAPLTGHHPKAA